MCQLSIWLLSNRKKIAQPLLNMTSQFLIYVLLFFFFKSSSRALELTFVWITGICSTFRCSVAVDFMFFFLFLLFFSNKWMFVLMTFQFENFSEKLGAYGVGEFHFFHPVFGSIYFTWPNTGGKNNPHEKLSVVCVCCGRNFYLINCLVQTWDSIHNLFESIQWLWWWQPQDILCTFMYEKNKKDEKIL